MNPLRVLPAMDIDQSECRSTFGDPSCKYWPLDGSVTYLTQKTNVSNKTKATIVLSSYMKNFLLFLAKYSNMGLTYSFKELWDIFN